MPPIQTKRTGVNPDLAKERLTATFDPQELTYLIRRGEEETKRQRMLERFILDDPVFNTDPPADHHSYEELYSKSLENAAKVIKKVRDHEDTVGDIESLMELFLNFMGSKPFPAGVPIGVHYAMFIPALLGQCSEEQQIEWVPKALDLTVIGCYAQTEIGHGTHLRGLETTAIYDPQTEEFIINSPTLTSIKWWPGSMGRTCNYALVMAQLSTKGQQYGLHPFLVQIRDDARHRPLTGVEVGEIGPKLGGNCVDNGYLRFDNVRIPRKQMLMKNAKVLPDGTYVRPPSDKLGYGTMVFIRVLISRDSAAKLAMASTIAVRYSAIRRQSAIEEDKPEPQVLDFQSQQYKLFPMVATAYAMWFASMDMWDVYRQINSSVLAGKFEGMAELHALSSGLKAITSDMASNGVEVCRLACGGHGYLSAAGFTRIYGSITAAVTYEGENTVLYLQTAKYLMKSYREAQSGKPVQHSVAYLACNAETNPVSKDPQLNRLATIYQKTAASLVADTAARLQEATTKRNSAALAWNDCHIYLIKCAKMHSQSYIVATFLKLLNNAEMSTSLGNVLTDLFKLYSLYWIRENAGDFLRFGSLTSQEFSNFETQIQNLLASIRPNIVSLVDAFDFHDNRLNSVLGFYDGWVYERMYENAKALPTNQDVISERDWRALREIQAKL